MYVKKVLYHIMENYIYESKFEALKEIFEIENIHNQWTSEKVSSKQFLEILSKDEYNISKLTGLCAQSVSKLNKKFFPGKKNNSKPCTYLLSKYGLKHCTHCGKVFNIEDFHNNLSKSTGKDSYCKSCFNDIVRDSRKEYSAKRKAEKLNAIPIWADLLKIKQIYDNCPEGYHVDHIIPLKGDIVCGLHVETNLQYLTAKENLEKSNKFIAA